MIPVILIIMGIIYYVFNPELSVYFPKCLWYMLTDTYCPSCGVQRMFSHLLHGEFVMAFKVNPFLMISIPYAVLAVVGKWYNYHHCFDKLNRFIYSRKVLIAYVILFFIWWIVRNILGI